MLGTNKKLISVVLPCHNEEGNVPLLYDRIIEIWENYKEKYNLEIIFVNDASKDNTWGEIKKLAEKDKRVKGISFSRNFMHPAALEAGINHAKGDAVIMMDADLEKPPEMIHEFIQKWEEGYEIVNAQRENYDNVNFLKRITSYGFYWLLNKISEIKIEPGTPDFRLVDKKVADALRNLKEREKFYRGLVNWVGFKKVVVRYKEQNRVYGQPSYTWKKLIKLARIGILSFSFAPLKFTILFGVLQTFISGVFMIMGLISKFTPFKLFGDTGLLFSIIFFNSGVIMLAISAVSIYEIELLKTLRGRPSYIISEKVNDEN